MNPPTTSQLDAYKAQTDRVAKLAEFVARFAPAIGETTASGFDRGVLIDDDTPHTILAARNTAILAAFGAIRDIAART